jgi:hypothetical protein
MHLILSVVGHGRQLFNTALEFQSCFEPRISFCKFINKFSHVMYVAVDRCRCIVAMLCV